MSEKKQRGEERCQVTELSGTNKTTMGKKMGEYGQTTKSRLKIRIQYDLTIKTHE